MTETVPAVILEVKTELHLRSACGWNRSTGKVSNE